MNIISAKDLTIEYLSDLFERSDRLKRFSAYPNPLYTSYSIIGLWFSQPSTRTRLSFSAACARKGIARLDIGDDEMISISKGEDFTDTMRMLNNYCDALIVRHPRGDIFKQILPCAKIPVINAGNGEDEHPTQAMLDMYTVQKYHHWDTSRFLIIGNTSRTIRSFCFLIRDPRNYVYFCVKPDEKLDADIVVHLLGNGVDGEIIYDIRDAKDVDVVYANRDKDIADDNRITVDYVKTFLREDSIILHPLPRINEISRDVDALSQAKYFEQAENGLFVRMAILDTLLNCNV